MHDGTVHGDLASRREIRGERGGKKIHIRAVECRTVFETISSSVNYGTFMA